MLESWFNKAKEAGDDMNNITIIELSSGTSYPKKIMISNTHPEKMRGIETAVTKLMESSDTSDSKLDEDNLNWILI